MSKPNTVDAGILAPCSGTCLDGTPLEQRVLLAKNIKPPVVVIDRAVPTPAMARILYFQGTAGSLSCRKPDNIYAKEA